MWLGWLTAEDLPLVSAQYMQLATRIAEDYVHRTVPSLGPEVDVLKADADNYEIYLAEGLEDLSQSAFFALGQWNEAGRLAALAQDAEALTSIYRWHRRVTRGVAGIEEERRNLRTAIEGPELDFEAAAQAFSDIARALAGRA